MLKEATTQKISALDCIPTPTCFFNLDRTRAASKSKQWVLISYLQQGFRSLALSHADQGTATLTPLLTHHNALG